MAAWATVICHVILQAVLSARSFGYVEGTYSPFEFLKSEKPIFLVAFSGDALPASPSFICVNSTFSGESQDNITHRVQYQGPDDKNPEEWQPKHVDVTFKILDSEKSRPTLDILEMRPPVQPAYLGNFSILLITKHCFIVGDKMLDEVVPAAHNNHPTTHIKPAPSVNLGNEAADFLTRKRRNKALVDLVGDFSNKCMHSLSELNGNFRTESPIYQPRHTPLTTRGK
ncbi:uncharacterized protein LOC144102350 [Amblyomma americanum]